IAAECYRPNAFARIIDSRNRLVSIVDNYRLLSYDLGPTLLSWLERHDPVTYRRLIAADLAMDGGMAQGFGHLIMPLCNERDPPNGSIDTRRPYRCVHPAGSGLGIDIVFYDGGLSHDIAFGLGSMNSQALLDRVDAAAGADGGLVTLAADGETFGHHHRYGDR